MSLQASFLSTPNGTGVAAFRLVADDSFVLIEVHGYLGRRAAECKASTQREQSHDGVLFRSPWKMLGSVDVSYTNSPVH